MKAEPVKWQVECKLAAETVVKHLKENLSFKAEYCDLINDLETNILTSSHFKDPEPDTTFGTEIKT